MIFLTYHRSTCWILTHIFGFLQAQTKRYVELESNEKVLHLEKMKTYHIADRNLDCWDVHTKNERFWVITEPTNLYPQSLFPGLDFALTFHLGLTMRVAARQRGPSSEIQESRLHVAWRKWEDSAATLENGRETEDFQPVGMKCRECLIELTKSLSKNEMIPKGTEGPPQQSNFVAWSEIIADYYGPGSRNQDIRSYLKIIAKSTWQLVNWLTHYSEANRKDASFSLDATQNVLQAFGEAVARFESKAPEKCPKCGSYAIEIGYDPELEPDPYISA